MPQNRPGPQPVGGMGPSQPFSVSQASPYSPEKAGAGMGLHSTVGMIKGAGGVSDELQKRALMAQLARFYG
jgi:hypothetical protein